MKHHKIYQPSHWVAGTPLKQLSGGLLWTDPDKYPELDMATEGELVSLLEALYENDHVSFEAVENLEIMLASVRIVDIIVKRLKTN